MMATQHLIGFDNDTAASLSLHWVMASGTDYKSGSITPNTWKTYASTSFAQGTTGNILSAVSNEFLLTGVQMEIGETETEFEHRSFAEELYLCHRYYRLLDDGAQTSAIANCAEYSTTKAYATIPLSPPMRTRPSLDQESGTDYYGILSAGTAKTFNDFTISTGNSTEKFARLENNQTPSLTVGRAGWFKTVNTSAYIALDAEM